MLPRLGRSVKPPDAPELVPAVLVMVEIGYLEWKGRERMEWGEEN